MVPMLGRSNPTPNPLPFGKGEGSWLMMSTPGMPPPLTPPLSGEGKVNNADGSNPTPNPLPFGKGQGSWLLMVSTLGGV